MANLYNNLPTVYSYVTFFSRKTMFPDTNQAPIISSLVAGKISYTSGAETQSLQIAGGFADINNNQISVCVEL